MFTLLDQNFHNTTKKIRISFQSRIKVLSQVEVEAHTSKWATTGKKFYDQESCESISKPRKIKPDAKIVVSILPKECCHALHTLARCCACQLNTMLRGLHRILVSLYHIQSCKLSSRH